MQYSSLLRMFVTVPRFIHILNDYDINTFKILLRYVEVHNVHVLFVSPDLKSFHSSF